MTDWAKAIEGKIALAKRNIALHGFDGYTTNLPLVALLDDDVLIAHSVFDAPLSQEHGWPARMVVPKRYAWKGAKWLSAIEFHEKVRPGFWEMRGYHIDADPWLEQRFSVPDGDASRYF